MERWGIGNPGRTGSRRLLPGRGDPTRNQGLCSSEVGVEEMDLGLGKIFPSREDPGRSQNPCSNGVGLEGMELGSGKIFPSRGDPGCSPNPCSNGAEVGVRWGKELRYWVVPLGSRQDECSWCKGV